MTEPQPFEKAPLVLLAGATVCAGAFLWLGRHLMAPLLASIRLPLMLAIAAAWLGLGAALVVGWRAHRHDRQSRNVLLLAAVFAAIAGASCAWPIAKMEFIKRRVLASEQASLEVVGRHVMVGYTDADWLRGLIAKGAVGGVFVTARNARQLTQGALAAEIASFQLTAQRHGHPPLVIATDQEGAGIARLSPPLPRPPKLGPVGGDVTPGLTAGRDLARVGVNLNFAPVADLDFGIRNPADAMSRIGERAVSSDPATTEAAVAQYCRELAQSNVRCTLKHFPGLGRVVADTHLHAAELTVAVADLSARDWVPFRVGAKPLRHGAQEIRDAVAVMVGHVSLREIDPGRPASVSKRVIDGILRRDLRFDGVVVTDDLNMYAVFDLPGGIGQASVDALNAGVDILLVAYDPAQVFPVLDALLVAHRGGALDVAALTQSRKRLAKPISIVTAPR